MPKSTHPIKPPAKGLFRVLGLMSGTSMDGIDVALLETDGKRIIIPRGFMSIPYPEAFRKKLRGALGKTKAPAVEKELTVRHVQAVKLFLKKKRLKANSISMIGFHGHTIMHTPAKRKTVQIGDGKALARACGIPVIYDFRTDDVKAGGQGAPLVPIYHLALAGKHKKPLAFLNIGGVANITVIDEKGELLAFDTGPGGAMLDDWVLRHKGRPYDRGGALALRGEVDTAHVGRFLRHPYFRKKPPKSLDRDAFRDCVPCHLNAEDGAATLTAMTALSISAGLLHSKKKLRHIVVCGGGRKNRTLMKMIESFAGVPVIPVENLGYKGDAIEAEAFAYLAARVVLGLPITFKGTTGRR